MSAQEVSAVRPVISEFLASNAGGLADEDGDTPDWIEIHNPGPAVADLGGWFLTDSEASPKRWRDKVESGQCGAPISATHSPVQLRVA